MSEIIAVIPFKDEFHLTRSIVESINTYDLKYLQLFNNDSDPDLVAEFKEWFDNNHPDEIDANLCNGSHGYPAKHCRDASGMGIYQMWNEGIRMAMALSEKEDIDIAILNNDIVLQPRALKRMSDILRSDPTIGLVYPNYDISVESSLYPATYTTKDTAGTFKDGGMGGFCFMVKAELYRDGLVPLVDENFGWWFGDDFLEMKVREAGYRVCRIMELPVDHLSEATASNGENEWTHPQKDRDAAHWNRTYR